MITSINPSASSQAVSRVKANDVPISEQASDSNLLSTDNTESSVQLTAFNPSAVNDTDSRKFADSDEVAAYPLVREGVKLIEQGGKAYIEGIREGAEFVGNGIREGGKVVGNGIKEGSIKAIKGVKQLEQHKKATIEEVGRRLNNASEALQGR